MAALGAALVIVVAEADPVPWQAFLGYGALMLLATLLFVVLAHRYRYVNCRTVNQIDSIQYQQRY
jgi:membrane protein YdbS with pleckstrin-like domain